MTRLTLSALLTATLLAGCAASSPQQTASAAASQPVCIKNYLIDHTEIPDDNTILFHMRDHTVWKNTLSGRCVGLKMATEGFVMNIDPTNTICSNLQTIRVRDNHNVCLLGEFTPYTPPKSVTR